MRRASNILAGLAAAGVCALMVWITLGSGLQTVIYNLVFLGIMLGLNGYAKIWALFGSANQLLAGLGLLAVATWLGNIGKDNSMFLFPMCFMLVVTICSLIINTKNQFAIIGAGGADWGPWVQAILGILLVILALVLAHEGIQTISNTKKKAA